MAGLCWKALSSLCLFVSFFLSCLLFSFTLALVTFCFFFCVCVLNEVFVLKWKTRNLFWFRYFFYFSGVFFFFGCVCVYGCVLCYCHMVLAVFSFVCTLWDNDFLNWLSFLFDRVGVWFLRLFIPFCFYGAVGAELVGKYNLKGGGIKKKNRGSTCPFFGEWRTILIISLPSSSLPFSPHHQFFVCVFVYVCVDCLNLHVLKKWVGPFLLSFFWRDVKSICCLWNKKEK